MTKRALLEENVNYKSCKLEKKTFVLNSFRHNPKLINRENDEKVIFTQVQVIKFFCHELLSLYFGL